MTSAQEDPPPDFAEVDRTWSPAPESVRGELGPWPAQALAALLACPAPAYGEDLPPLWSELYLRTTRASSELAPDGHPVQDALVPPLARRRRMFGGGRVRVREPLRVGDEAERTSSVQSTRVRRGRSGWLLLVTERHVHSVGGTERVSEERDVVYRQPVDASGDQGRDGAGPVAGLPPDPDAVLVGRPAFELLADVPLLFCFSALTYNAHRIHYDRGYAVDVEGYQDLLVHGPLLALGAVEAARRRSSRLIGSLTYRLTAPAHPAEPVHFRVADRDRGSATVTGEQAGRVVVQAQVGWGSI